ncbi:hypothetical protein ABS71_18705 [bacterium SCN 62-11]|nr:hypothetical protein [Candidatus Eremiobacteraeota bacterium]ODT58665.1 MAG: hypothetical protein ABS71_18705 [bacterium SCN 62-11]
MFLLLTGSAAAQATVEVCGDEARTRRLDAVEVLEDGHTRTIDGTFELTAGDHHLRLRRQNFLDAEFDLKITDATRYLQIWLRPDPAIDHPLRQSGNLLIAFAEGSPDFDDPIWHQTMSGAGSHGLGNVFSPFERKNYEATNFLLAYNFADPFFSRMLPLDKKPEKVCFNADGTLLFVSYRDELVVYQFNQELTVKVRHPLKTPLTALQLAPQENLVVAADAKQLSCYDGAQGNRTGSLPLKDTPESLTIHHGKVFALVPYGLATFQLRPRLQPLGVRKIWSRLTELRPHPITGQLFAACPGENALWKFDTPIQRLETPPAPVHLWLDEQRAYVTHRQSRTVSVVDLASGKLLNRAPIGPIVDLVFASNTLYVCLRNKVQAFDRNGKPVGRSIWFSHGFPQSLALIP